ncbi:hypothetical protein AVDCRST_MAG84-6189 [uncultured Microcoleus sp.]|uniref:Uncharacterized protein n=1 Tax=uncultured Microcoleus sp. TaxID=259945 RepID=A0A6J4P0Y0_9CYAN|nr:hypothetical protein AVDCRST_MAG84-6189 [uncultured Microcoleus sp.]
MTFTEGCPGGRSQDFTLPRRGFLQKAASAALLFLASRSQLIVAALKGRSAPKFSLGDKVAIDWSDDWGGHFADFGEIVGLCYLPPENTWIYYVNWTHSNRTDGHNNGYPIFFEGESEITDRLRFSNHV